MGSRCLLRKQLPPKRSISSTFAMSLAHAGSRRFLRNGCRPRERQADSGTVQVDDCVGELVSFVPCACFHP